jgi:hypothetical protein
MDSEQVGMTQPEGFPTSGNDQKTNIQFQTPQLAAGRFIVLSNGIVFYF